MSQAFAVEAARAGLAGIRYLVRHDPAQEFHGIALFGPAGDPDAPESASGVDADLGRDLQPEARAVFGSRILPTP